MTYTKWREEVTALSNRIYSSHQVNETFDIFNVMSEFPQASIPTIREALYELEGSKRLQSLDSGNYILL